MGHWWISIQEKPCQQISSCSYQSLGYDYGDPSSNLGKLFYHLLFHEQLITFCWQAIHVLPLICLYRFLVIACPCHSENLIITCLSSKAAVWLSLGNFWWFTRYLVNLVEYRNLCFKLLIILHLLFSRCLQMLLHMTIYFLFLHLSLRPLIIDAYFTHLLLYFYF